MTKQSGAKDNSGPYLPDPSVRENAWISDYEQVYGDFLKDPDGFWEKIAGELEWFRKWDQVKVLEHPYARWFEGGQLNEERVLTYRQLYRQVMRFANGLKKLGIKKGDRICFYIGAVHSVVYAGFGSQALHARIIDAEAKMVITADVGIRRGKRINLKSIVDEAVVNAPTVENIVVLNRSQPHLELYSEMEVDFYEIMEGVESECPAEVMDAEDPLHGCGGSTFHPLYLRYHRSGKGNCTYLWRVCGGMRWERTTRQNISLILRIVMCTGVLLIQDGLQGTVISSMVRFQSVQPV